MNVNAELTVILSTEGYNEIIKKLNYSEELSQSEILLIFNALAQKNRENRKKKSINKQIRAISYLLFFYS